MCFTMWEQQQSCMPHYMPLSATTPKSPLSSPPQTPAAPPQCSRTVRAHLTGEAQHELGIDPGPGAQQRHCGSDDQRHLPAGSEGDDVCRNDGDQGLDDQAQLVPHCPPDVQGIRGQPGCDCTTGILLLIKPAYFLYEYRTVINGYRCSS